MKGPKGVIILIEREMVQAWGWRVELRGSNGEPPLLAHNIKSTDWSQVCGAALWWADTLHAPVYLRKSFGLAGKRISKKDLRSAWRGKKAVS